MKKPVCAVIGIGPGNGAAIARRFSDASYQVALLSRSTEFTRPLAEELGNARAIDCDVTEASSIEQAFADVREHLGEVDVLVYNAGGAARWATVDDLSPADFDASWRVNALGALLATQQVIQAMKKGRAGSIVFIGATASRRGGARTAAFAPAKAAQRSLAESMAKHLWPAGIHVALIIIDGVVDLPATRKVMADKDSDFFVKPAAVAEIAYQLAIQDPSAWSFEVEARPFGEVW